MSTSKHTFQTFTKEAARAEWLQINGNSNQSNDLTSALPLAQKLPTSISDSRLDIVSNAAITNIITAIVSSVVSLIALSVMLIVFMRFVICPIRQVIDGLIATASGQGFDDQMYENRKDEFGELAHHFNGFVRSVHGFIEACRP
jgi:methyl-accepting chemotaxis protein